MRKILTRLPYLDRHETVTVSGTSVRLRPFQVIIWVSLHLKGVPELEPNAPRFPAILDTGNNYTFTIMEHQLLRWAGIRSELLHVLGPVVLNNVVMERRAASVWIHPNHKDQRHSVRAGSAYRLELERGIAVYPEQAAVPGPRLPLLGLRALDENDLDLRIGGRRRRVWLRAPSRLLDLW